MNIFYWSPFLSEVATVRAVLNSAISISKYSKNSIKPYIINSVGEWNSFKDEISQNNVGLINFNKNINTYKELPRYGFLKSRFSYIFIFIISFFKLFNFLKSLKKDDYIIIHLISSLPLILLLLFNFKCKFILRISGYPKLNFLRKILWKISNKKLFLIFCPTDDTRKFLEKNNIFNEKKLFVLFDPVIEFNKIQNLKKKRIYETKVKKYVLSVGRLTKQKNHKFLINNFKKIVDIEPDLKLIVLGDGELKKKLINLSKRLNLDNKIIFLGHVKNVYKFFKNAYCFILTSNWEDPGFVLIEAAATRTPILSADCPNGPIEFLSSDMGGYLYKKNDNENFIEKFQLLVENKKNKIDFHKTKILFSLKKSKNYTNFRHYLNLSHIIKSN